MASIRRMPQGSWQAIVRRKGYRAQFHTFDSRHNAQQWARKLESEIDRAVFVDRGPSERITFGELIDRYCTEIVPGKKSARSLTATLRYIRPHFATYTLATLQTKDVAAYRDQRIANGTAGATVVKELSTLARVIDIAASEWGYFVAVNPAKQTRRPPVARGRERRLSASEETALLQACDRSRAPMLKGILILALETGMRLGELLALNWNTLDLARRTARLGDTKNGESRTVPLSTVAIATLSSLPRHISDRRVF
jgi:integrase